MYPKLFDIEFLDSFFIMISLGVIICAIIIFIKIKKIKPTKNFLIDFFGTLVASGMLMYVGAHLFDSLFHSIEEGKLVQGGITFIGGFLTGVISFYYIFTLVEPYQKKNMLYYLNVIIVGIVIAHAFGRVGCFLAGCCYGKPTESIFGVTFPQGSAAYFEYGPFNKVLPTQLFEALFLLVLFIVLLLLKKNQFILYLLSYGTFRFLIEFLRGDDRGSLVLLSPSQWLSLVMIGFGIYLLIKKPNQNYYPIEEKVLEENF